MGEGPLIEVEEDVGLEEEVGVGVGVEEGEGVEEVSEVGVAVTVVDRRSWEEGAWVFWVEDTGELRGVKE